MNIKSTRSYADGCKSSEKPYSTHITSNILSFKKREENQTEVTEKASMRIDGVAWNNDNSTAR